LLLQRQFAVQTQTCYFCMHVSTSIVCEQVALAQQIHNQHESVHHADLVQS